MVTIPIGVPESGNEYIKFPDGTLIQWGAFNTADASVDVRITFPCHFVDLNYSLSYCKFWFEHDYYLTFFSEAIDGIKAKPMKININGSYNMDEGTRIGGRWLAVGHWK